jgi:hypothetical protein
VEVAATSGYDAASRALAAQSVGVFLLAFSPHAESSPTRISHSFLLVLLITSAELSSTVRVYPKLLLFVGEGKLEVLSV